MVMMISTAAMAAEFCRPPMEVQQLAIERREDDCQNGCPENRAGEGPENPSEGERHRNEQHDQGMVFHVAHAGAPLRRHSGGREHSGGQLKRPQIAIQALVNKRPRSRDAASAALRRSSDRHQSSRRPRPRPRLAFLDQMQARSSRRPGPARACGRSGPAASGGLPPYRHRRSTHNRHVVNARLDYPSG